MAILFPHEVEYGSPILQCKVIYNRTAVSVMVCFGLIPRTAMVFWGFVPSMGDLNLLTELEIETPDSRIA